MFVLRPIVRKLSLKCAKIISCRAECSWDGGGDSHFSSGSDSYFSSGGGSHFSSGGDSHFSSDTPLHTATYMDKKHGADSHFSDDTPNQTATYLSQKYMNDMIYLSDDTYLHTATHKSQKVSELSKKREDFHNWSDKTYHQLKNDHKFGSRLYMVFLFSCSFAFGYFMFMKFHKAIKHTCKKTIN